MTWCSSISIWYVFLVIDALFVILVTSFFGFPLRSRIAHTMLCMSLSVGAATHFITETTKGSFHNLTSKEVEHWIESLFWTMVLLCVSLWWFYYGLTAKVRKCVHRFRRQFCPSSVRVQAQNQASPDHTSVLPRVVPDNLSFSQVPFDDDTDSFDTLDGLHRYIASRRRSDVYGVGAVEDEESVISEREQVEGG
eukprot:TRINITY_DN51244_c0_g1_i1.p1 TRINITY_DN51244_c0_g1~~TRINITY_DN51244_c0_g1_i1.p1  ORF type:complete len:212 (-),score=9.46 TRINITY_DN51244_c0_g1_i1:120-701(-)